MKKLFLTLLVISIFGDLHAQELFPYELQLSPITLEGFTGLHSFAYGKHQNTWLLLGGRKDGLHARQPNSAFPQTQNNTTLYAIDILTQQVWSRLLTELPIGIQEQLQSTNMNFHQVGDTLYIIGGYAFSATANTPITFPKLTTVLVSEVIQAIKQNQPIANFIKQVTDQQFAVTGGHLVAVNDTFLLVGGHRFDGRYNPMGNPTYTQAYTNQVRRFFIHNTDTIPQVTHLSPITDELHLHRRDYNLIPRITANNELEFCISSGVFQPTANLPFLYPVEVSTSNIKPITSFNQYLSNYHSAVANIVERSSRTQYHLFFGGMSRYYYQDDSLWEDTNVPFVKTISVLKRTNDTLLQELKLPLEMPSLKGAGAEFILNDNAPHWHEEFIDLEQAEEDTVLVGYIVGGIQSPTANPFTNNQTTTTSADPTVYAVRLIKHTSTNGIESVNHRLKLYTTLFPNPASEQVDLLVNLPLLGNVYITWTDASGRIIAQNTLPNQASGEQLIKLTIPEHATGKLMVTISLNHIYFNSTWIDVLKK